MPAIRRIAADRRGSVAIIAALVMTVLCGAAGLAIDVGMWYRTNRAMQNAADAAAIAAAHDGTSTYQQTGKAVAAQYGFVDGSGGITTTIANNQTCPDGTTNCYSATISDASGPQFFSKMLGVGAPTLTSAAMAGNGGGVHTYCMLVLATSGASPGLLSDGSPKADMSGCGIMSNTDMTCHGHNLNADYGDSAGTNSGCGNVVNNNVPKVSDPFSGMAAKDIPANTCSTYYQEDKNGKGLPASNLWAGAVLLPATTIVCGDLQLTADTVITSASPGSVVVIENGTLDLNNNTLQTLLGSGLTLVFTGTSGHYSALPYPSGNGVLNITAPTSGTWSGIAIYLDPAIPAQTVTYAGNGPTWDITGVVYMPHAALTFKGAVNKGSNGTSCFVLVVDSISIQGTGAILAHGGCASAGVTMPSNTVNGGVVSLVM